MAVAKIWMETKVLTVHLVEDGASFQASGPVDAVRDLAEKWQAEHPAKPKDKEEEPKLRGTGFSSTERRGNWDAPADGFSGRLGD
jgi:hypothetical protein